MKSASKKKATKLKKSVASQREPSTKLVPGADKSPESRKSAFSKFNVELLGIPLEFIIQLAPGNFRGWYAVGKRTAMRFGQIIERIESIQYVFILMSLGLTGVSLMPWIGYEIELIDAEAIRIGSNFKTLFAVPGLLGILMLITDLPFRKRIYYTVFGITLALYLPGFIFPNPIHTKMLNRGEYYFLPWLYIYGILSILTLYFAWKTLDRPVFRIKKYLIEDSAARSIR